MSSESRMDRLLADSGYADRPDVRAQAAVLLRALDLYAERNVDYKDNWRRSGWRGVLVRVRERTDRLWDLWWDRSQRPVEDPDDAIDLINFAAFLVRATRGEATRDGVWWE